MAGTFTLAADLLHSHWHIQDLFNEFDGSGISDYISHVFIFLPLAILSNTLFMLIANLFVFLDAYVDKPVYQAPPIEHLELKHVETIVGRLVAYSAFN